MILGAGELPESAFIAREWLAALKACAALHPDLTWVNNPISQASANLKIRNLQIAQTVGFSVPDTLVTNSPEEFNEFRTRFAGDIIYKPLTYYYEEPDPGGRWLWLEHAVSVPISPIDRIRSKEIEDFLELPQ